MFRGHFFLRFLGALLLIALLVGGGTLLFRTGVSQGYVMGLAASGKELTAPAPGINPVPGLVPGNPAYGYGLYRPFYMPFFAPFGFIGGPLFLLFFLFAVGMIFRMIFSMLFWGRHAMWRNGPGYYGPWGSQPPDPKTSEGQTGSGQSGQPKA